MGLRLLWLFDGSPLSGVSGAAEATILREESSSLQASARLWALRNRPLRSPTGRIFPKWGHALAYEIYDQLIPPGARPWLLSQAGQKLNDRKSIRIRLPCFSSALGLYFSFCELIAPQISRFRKGGTSSDRHLQGWSYVRELCELRPGRAFSPKRSQFVVPRGR